MKSKHLLLLAVALVLVVAAFTNPGPDVHKEKVRSTLKSYLQQETAHKKSDTSNGDWAEAGHALGSLFATALIDRMVEGAVTSDNYVFFSLTKITWDGQEKNIGFGAFGSVWLSGNLKDMKQKSQ